MTTEFALNSPAYLNIGINAHLLSGEAGYRRAGIHQYIFQVLNHLPAASSNGLRYTVYTRQADKLAARADMHLSGTLLPTGNRVARIIWEKAIWPVQARRDRLDLLHSLAFVMPPFAPCPAIVTIYDLSFIHYPQDFPAAQRRYLTAETTASCRRAQRIITISESGRRDVQAFFGVAPEKIDVIRPGVSPAYRPLPDEAVAAFRARHKLPERFLLHVGTLQPRKNITTLIRSLSLLNRPDLRLVLVGGKGWMYDTLFAQVESLGLAGQVQFAGYAEDDDLPLWYNAATALIMPSRYEGFGLPIVEALACGTPVVAAETSSLPEAGGAAALYFDPYSPDDLADQIRRLLDDEQLVDRIRGTGPEQAARFSWAHAGQETAAAYLAALGRLMPAGEQQTG